MQKPRIALVIEGTYPWYRGGVSEWIAQYINAFADYHFHIVQIATDPYLQTDLSSALYEIPHNVIGFERLPPPEHNPDWEKETRRWFNNYVHGVKFAFETADIIHVANTGFAGWLGLQLATQLQKPLILTEHALYWKEVEMGAVALECGYKVPDSRIGKKQMALQFKQIAADIYASAEEVISVSRCNINEQKELGADSIHYIANGVKKDWLDSDTSKNGNKVPVIGWIGRCAEMKNPLKFFEIIDAIDKQGYHDAHFVMMICDANEPDLQKKVEEKARAYPQLELICNQPAENHLHKMDALCITSHNESQPLVLFEALGKKVLPIGWIAGDVTKKYGIIVPPDYSSEMLIDKVITLWQQPEKWQAEVDRRYRLVKNEHTWKTIFQQYRQLFQPYLKESTVYEG